MDKQKQAAQSAGLGTNHPFSHVRQGVGCFLCLSLLFAIFASVIPLSVNNSTRSPPPYRVRLWTEGCFVDTSKYDYEAMEPEAVTDITTWRGSDARDFNPVYTSFCPPLDSRSSPSVPRCMGELNCSDGFASVMNAENADRWCGKFPEPDPVHRHLNLSSESDEDRPKTGVVWWQVAAVWFR